MNHNNSTAVPKNNADNHANNSIADPTIVRFATFNTSLERHRASKLIEDLSTPDNAQAQTIAEIIQRTQPDVILLNEFDYDSNGEALSLFQTNYLEISQNGADIIHYDYSFLAPSNTGIHSGFDLDNNGRVVATPGSPGYGDDAFGFGEFEGQYGMAILSKYPLNDEHIRTFQTFLWKDMPGALLPSNPDTDNDADWFSDQKLDIVRLSSKSHWDIPIIVGTHTIHLLASHPTPPAFDGPERRNQRRNHDEIRFWVDYISESSADYIYDDKGNVGGLDETESFVIAGDLNADPNDGSGIKDSIVNLLNHERVNSSIIPKSAGAVEQSEKQGRINNDHDGDPAYDTADFEDSNVGNLRVDYVLPSTDLIIEDAGVFWPLESDSTFELVGTFPYPGSDHRLVWIDISLR